MDKVYFRECDLNRQEQYQQYSDGKTPFHQGLDLEYNSKQHTDPLRKKVFPRQCGTELDSLQYEGPLLKESNMIVEVFVRCTTCDGKYKQNWYRAGIITLINCVNYVELSYICTDSINTSFDTKQTVFTHSMDFAMQFACGKAPQQTTNGKDNIMYKYSSTGGLAYGTKKTNPQHKALWADVGKYVVLNASTLRSMTTYMHYGFKITSVEVATRLDNASKTGLALKTTDYPSGVISEGIRNTYFKNCCDCGLEVEMPKGPLHDGTMPFSTYQWKAMQTLTTFNNHKDVYKVQKAIGDTLKEDESFRKKELDSALIQKLITDNNVTLVDAFAYAVFAMVVALTLLYTNPIDVLTILKDNDNSEKTIQNIGKHLGDKIKHLNEQVVNEIQNLHQSEEKMKQLALEMLNLAKSIVEGSYIPMVILNRYAQQ